MEQGQTCEWLRDSEGDRPLTPVAAVPSRHVVVGGRVR